MKTFIVAVVYLFATPALFGQGQTQSGDQEPVTPAARKMNWTSAGALNALFKDKVHVGRFLNEIANAGDAGGPTLVVNVFDYRFVDLNGDGRLELVAVMGGDRLRSTALEVVFQTPDGTPPADRLATTHDGFVLRELHGDVPNLKEVLRDLDGDGTLEIVVPQPIGDIVGASRPQANIPEVFAWKDDDYANVSARYPKFYRDEVLPRLERQLQMLEMLPRSGDPSEAADRRAERENVVREIAEARKRAKRK